MNSPRAFGVGGLRTFPSGKYHKEVAMRNASNRRVAVQVMALQSTQHVFGAVSTNCKVGYCPCPFDVKHYSVMMWYSDVG